MLDLIPGDVLASLVFAGIGLLLFPIVLLFAERSALYVQPTDDEKRQFYSAGALLFAFVGSFVGLAVHRFTTWFASAPLSLSFEMSMGNDTAVFIVLGLVGAVIALLLKTTNNASHIPADRRNRMYNWLSVLMFLVFGGAGWLVYKLISFGSTVLFVSC